MRPVNLLPQSARPYVASGKAGKGSYILLGVLAALVLAVAAYVLTANKITSSHSKIATAQQETQQAQARASVRIEPNVAIDDQEIGLLIDQLQHFHETLQLAAVEFARFIRHHGINGRGPVG